MYHTHLQAPPPPSFVEHYSAISWAITDHGYKQTNAPISAVPIQTIKFDDQQELLWSGNVAGHATSLYSDQLTKYTSFAVGCEEPVLQFLTGDFGLLCLIRDELKLKNRRGIPKNSYSSSTFKNMLCMTKLPSQLVLLGGLSQNLIEFDLERQRQLRTTDLGSNEIGCCLVKQHPKFVCCADLEGRITLRNTNNLAVNHTFKTHTGQIADFDVHGNYLITCGYPSSRPTPDRFIMVYDLRNFRLVTPIPSIFPPSMVKFIPAFTSKFCLASSMGQFQILDVAVSAAENCTAFTHQVQLQPESSLTSLDISSSGQALAFGDDLGRIHLFGSNSSVVFNQFSNPTETADPLEPVPFIEPNDFITPLSVAAQSYNSYPVEGDPISADSNSHQPVRFYRTPKIDSRIIESMTKRSDVGYAPNPFKNQGHISYIKGRVGVVDLNHAGEDSTTNGSGAEYKDVIEY